MKIILNNREEEFNTDVLNVTKMLELKRFSFRMRIIKVNGILIQKEKFDTTFIQEGDNVLMLYLMSGG